MKLGFFSAEQTCRLAKISRSQLRHWYDTKVFRPQVIEGQTGAFRHVYSFRDVVGLRTISILRNTHRVALKDIRQIEQRLKSYSGCGMVNDRILRRGRRSRLF
jgi:DNA-binding transcriptional MerR regulator